MARVEDAAHARDRQYREVQQDFSGSPARASQEPSAELTDVQSSTERVEEREQRRAAGGRRQQLRQQRTEIAFPHDPADRAVGIRSIQDLAQGGEPLRIPFDEDPGHCPLRVRSRRSHEQQRRTRCAVVVAALSGVAVEEHHPTALNDRPGPSLRTAEGRPTRSRA